MAATCWTGKTRNSIIGGGAAKVGNSPSLRRKDHYDPPALHRWVLFELADFAELVDDPPHQLEALLHVGIFPAAEDHRKYDFVLLFQELLGPVDLGHQVVFTDFGPEAELFVPTVMSVPLVLPLLLLVLELSIVHDATDGWLLGWGNLDQIEPHFASLLQRLVRRDDSQLGSVMRNDANWRNADLFVDPL
jgi:hypothetical protein